jgi:hypothetical protein
MVRHFFHGMDLHRTHNFSGVGIDYIGWGQVINYIQSDIGSDDAPSIWSYKNENRVQRGITQRNTFSFWLLFDLYRWKWNNSKLWIVIYDYSQWFIVG